MRTRHSVPSYVYGLSCIVLLIHDGVMLACESTTIPRKKRLLPLAEMYTQGTKRA